MSWVLFYIGIFSTSTTCGYLNDGPFIKKFGIGLVIRLKSVCFCFIYTSLFTNIFRYWSGSIDVKMHGFNDYFVVAHWIIVSFGFFHSIYELLYHKMFQSLWKDLLAVIINCCVYAGIRFIHLGWNFGLYYLIAIFSVNILMFFIGYSIKYLLRDKYRRFPEIMYANDRWVKDKLAGVYQN